MYLLMCLLPPSLSHKLFYKSVPKSNSKDILTHIMEVVDLPMFKMLQAFLQAM